MRIDKLILTHNTLFCLCTLTRTLSSVPNKRPRSFIVASLPRPLLARLARLKESVGMFLFEGNPKCSFDPGFTVNWMVRLFSPFLILLVVAGGIVFAFRKSDDDQAINGVIRLVVQVLHVTFVGNVVHALQPLDCAEYACTCLLYTSPSPRD